MYVECLTRTIHQQQYIVLLTVGRIVVQMVWRWEWGAIKFIYLRAQLLYQQKIYVLICSKFGKVWIKRRIVASDVYEPFCSHVNLRQLHSNHEKCNLMASNWILTPDNMFLVTFIYPVPCVSADIQSEINSGAKKDCESGGRKCFLRIP